MRWIRKRLSLLVLALVFGYVTASVAQKDPSGDGKDAQLAGTPWRLVDLDGKPIRARSGFEPHFTLGDGSLLNASDGCNNLMGDYSADGDSLRIHVLASTSLACELQGRNISDPGSHTPRPAPKNLPESFVKALSGTVRFKIHGSTLELLNDDGAVLARMEVSKRIWLVGRNLEVDTWTKFGFSDTATFGPPEAEFPWTVIGKLPASTLQFWEVTDNATFEARRFGWGSVQKSAWFNTKCQYGVYESA
jgi:heat shock protein HslJ